MKFFSLVLFITTFFAGCNRLNDSGGSCITCHDKKHSLQTHSKVDCIQCHKGDNASIDKAKSHFGLVAFPGNLSNVDKTCGMCHRDDTDRVHKSLMTTNSGMIEITRKVFGETSDSGKHSGFKNLDPKNSPADSYFSQLCASCHLGREKKSIGASKGYEKGGGCLACHLEYKDKKKHPEIVKKPKDSACFNCHSRSGRISLNYNGLIEMEAADKSQIVLQMEDGRKLKKGVEDIHKTKGMSCVDCHKSMDVMGDGKNHLDKRDAIYTKCESCHDLPGSKNHNENHGRLHCTSCHNVWSPNCFGCHITYNPEKKGYSHLSESAENGRWIEEAGETFVKSPVLGVTGDGKIRPFIPAMKLTIDKSGFTGKKEKLIRQNLFAPSFSHTITRKGRGCASCHKSSYSLGFGEGRIFLKNNFWEFTSEYRKENGLPQDAWIKPFQEKYDPGDHSIRKDNRPLDKSEQIRILEVGKCLDCHTGNEKFFLDFTKNKNYSHIK